MKKFYVVYFGQLLIASSDYTFLCSTFCLVKLPPTFRGLAKCGTFSTTLQSKHQSSNLAQMFIRSTSPRISPKPCYLLPFFQSLFCLSCWVVVVRLLGSSFSFFVWFCAVGKNENVLPNALGVSAFHIVKASIVRKFNIGCPKWFSVPTF